MAAQSAAARTASTAERCCHQGRQRPGSSPARATRRTGAGELCPACPSTCSPATASHTTECKSAQCLSAWPAVRSKSMKPTLGKGVKGKVAIWHHNGMNQVTLNGHPLYTYSADSAGSAFGSGSEELRRHLVAAHRKRVRRWRKQQVLHRRQWRRRAGNRAFSAFSGRGA